MTHLVPLAEEHRRGFTDIFNHYILTSPSAFPERPVPDSFFDRFLGFAQTYPACAMIAEDGRMIGVALLHPYHWASTFDRVAEITYFIHPDHTHRGLGKAALDWLIERARLLGIDRILACISSLNLPSLNFHGKYGFFECGRFPQVGRKNGQEFDLVWMVRKIEAEED
jgi:phosphinothricin acetyltransferase